MVVLQAVTAELVIAIAVVTLFAAIVVALTRKLDE